MYLVNMGVDFEFPVREGPEPEGTSEAQKDKSPRRLKHGWELRSAFAVVVYWEAGECMGNIGEDQSELFLPIPESTAHKRYYPSYLSAILHHGKGL